MSNAIGLYQMTVIGLTTAEIGIIVTVMLFATAHLIMLMRWGSNLDRSTGILASRIDYLSEGLRQVEVAIAGLVDMNTRFTYLEKTVVENRERSIECHLDHETRIRVVEQSCKACGKTL